MKKIKILVIEDEEGIRDGLKHILHKTYELEFAVNGVDGLRRAIKNPPDLVLLDLKMPEMDGFQTCRALRGDQDFDDIPIIILSAFNNTSDRTKLFEMGADDYIVKPFDNNELLARIHRKIQDKKSKKSSTGSVEIDAADKDIQLDSKKSHLIVQGNVISLSAIEFKIMHMLVSHLNQLIPRQTLIEAVWENQTVSTRLVDPHILSLRNKLNDVNYTIQSIYGKGYILKNL